MKLGITYSIYNGEELLDNSIKQIHDHVDHVIICYQTVSNKGEERHDLEEKLQYFAKYEKVRLLNWEPDLNLNTKQNEMVKHNFMVNHARLLDCTHFLMGAADHYYIPEEFEKAKKKLIDSIFDVTLTAMFTYYKHPTWQLTPIEDYYMPFICKLHPSTTIQRNPKSPLRVDPSVQINTCNNWCLLNQQDIMLHHYSMIRKNIADKFRNAAASIRWEKGMVETFIDEYKNYDIEKNPGVIYFQERKIKIVEDIFGLNNKI